MVNRKKIIAITLSLGIHAALLGAIIFSGLFHAYRSVEGFQVGDYGGQPTVKLINPADYGYRRKPALSPPPRRMSKLEDLKRREKIRRDENQDVKEEENPAKAGEAAGEQPPEQELKPLTFGRLDTAPLKRHVAVLWQAHEQGRLDVPQKFRIVAVCKVDTDGSFSEIRVVESSGSDDLDRAALAILAEVSNQHAFAPLSRLSSVSVTLDIGLDSASFTLVGFAPNAALASDMASQYQMMISAARLLASNAQTRELLNRASIRNDSTRVSARLTLPRSRASQMMHEGFSKSE